MNMTLEQARDAMGAFGDLGGLDAAVVRAVCTDSRLTEGGELFVCLTGERFDGHAFAAKAVESGALAVVASRPVDIPEGAPLLMVQDTLDALGRLAGAWRTLSGKTGVTVVAVTGSSGKTSVKQMLAAILSRVGETAFNPGNLNNRIGVPRTILDCTGRERFWVLELGINLPGEMDALGAMVRPDMAVVVNVAPAHLAGLGSLEGVAEAKASLLKYLAPGGRAVVGADHPALAAAVDALGPTVSDTAPMRFTAKDADDCAVSCEYLGSRDGRGRYRLHLPGNVLELDLPVAGAYWAENVAAAATAAHALGASPEAVEAGLRAVVLPEHRFDVRRLGRLTLIDDCYNANPTSMAAAVDGAKEMARNIDGNDDPLVLILGDMLELGAQSAELHRDLGRTIAATQARAVIWHGEHAADVAAGLGNGNWPGRFTALPGQGGEATAAEALEALQLERGVILVKGSRGCRMERYVAALAGRAGAEER